MFKYVIKGTTKDRPFPSTIALTHYSDLAEYIKEHAVEALDPTGEQELTVELVTRPEADLYINRPKSNREEK